MLAITDFVTTIATRRGGVIRVVVVAQLVGLVLFSSFLFFTTSHPEVSDYAFGACAGAVVSMGLGFQLTSVRLGDISLAVPLVGLFASSVPVVYGLCTGRQPELLGILGMAIIPVSSLALSYPKSGKFHWRRMLTKQVVVAIASGVFFGAALALLGQIDSAAGPAPLVANRVASLVTAALFLRAFDRGLEVKPGWLLPTVLSGAFVVFGMGMFVLAASRLELEIVGAFVATSPALTSALAVVFLKERPSLIRYLGIALTVPALVLVAIGN